VLVTASIASNLGTVVGLVAGLIAIGGFLGHAGPVLSGAPDRRVQRATVTGGSIAGLVGTFVVVLSAIASMLDL
jgi:hypothetical protein